MDLIYTSIAKVGKSLGHKIPLTSVWLIPPGLGMRLTEWLNLSSDLMLAQACSFETNELSVSGLSLQ